MIPAILMIQTVAVIITWSRVNGKPREPIWSRDPSLSAGRMEPEVKVFRAGSKVIRELDDEKTRLILGY